MEDHSHQLMESTTNTVTQMVNPVVEAVQSFSAAPQQMQTWMAQQHAIMMNVQQQQAIFTPVTQGHLPGHRQMEDCILGRTNLQWVKECSEVVSWFASSFQAP